MLRHWFALVMLSTLGSVALAEVPSYVTVIDGSSTPWKIPVAEANFVFYEQVVSLEKAKTGLGVGLLLTSLHIESESAHELYRHIALAVSASSEFGAALSAKLCRDRDRIQTVEQLVAAFTQVDRDMESERERLATRSMAALSPADRSKLETFVRTEYRRQLRGQRIDYSKWMEVSGESPMAILERRCIPAGRVGSDARP